MNKKKCWFDIVNSPHVLILEPIIKELCRRQMEVVITAKDHSQTIGLLQQKGINHRVLGQHGGKSSLGKALALMNRVYSMFVYAVRVKPGLSVCHGSRELLIVSKLLGIPNVTLFDYEYSEHNIKNWAATLMMIPDVIPKDRLRSLGFRMERIYQYPGIKEHIYLPSFSYESEYVRSFGIDIRQVLVVFRPPATLSHYHDEQSERLIFPMLQYLDRPEVTVIIMPRYPSQVKEMKEQTRNLKNQPIILELPVDGPKLLAHADLVISGGGTMIREAAALQTPAYSIFSGKPGGVDEYLISQNLLVWIGSQEEIQKIRLEKKPRREVSSSHNNLVGLLCDKILSVS